MSVGLPVSLLIDVIVNQAPAAAQFANLNSCLIVGDSTVIDVKQRIRSYSSISAVATDFGTTAPEYLAALAYFSQSPTPNSLYIGRWAKTATPGINLGGILTAAQQLPTFWQNITNGGINITISGAAQNLTGLDFSAVTNMNGVASVINTALSTAGTCTWNGQQLVVQSSGTGAGAYATGTITFTGNPSASDTVTVNGTAITFVASSPTGNQVLIGSTSTDTAANLLAFLQASSNTNIVKMTYTRSGLVITATSVLIGTAGNAYTLEKSSTAITISGSVLSGGVVAATVGYATAGSGTDISVATGLTAATSTYLVAGIAAESAVAAVSVLDNLTTNWYFLNFATANNNTDIADSDNLAIAAYIEADANNPHIYALTTQETAALSTTDTTSIGYQLKQLGYKRTFYQYSSQSPYAAASMVGRYVVVNFNGNATTISGMYKQEPGIAPEVLSTSQYAALCANNYNFFAEFNNNTNIIVNGITPSGIFIDSIYNADWLANNIQTNVYNLLYQTPTKIPQTDAGNNVIANQIEASCAQAVANGYLAPGQWNSAGFGQLTQGAFLSKGYYIYFPPISTQSQATRDARQSVPFQIAVKEAGAIHDVNITINVNR